MFHSPLFASFYRKPGDESDAESSRETSSDRSGDYGVGRGLNNVVHGSRNQKDIAEANIHSRKGVLTKPSLGSSSDESETCNPPGRLVFEYMERDPPYSREPLADKASA